MLIENRANNELTTHKKLLSKKFSTKKLKNWINYTSKKYRQFDLKKQLLCYVKIVKHVNLIEFNVLIDKI